MRDLMPTTKARFMQRIIYAFKIMLLQKHFPMTEEMKEGMQILCHFYLHLYSLPWFTANFAAEAAFQDLQFLERARRYKKYGLIAIVLIFNTSTPHKYIFKNGQSYIFYQDP